MGTGRGRASASGRPPATARAVAARAVRRVTDEGAYSNLALPAEIERAGLTGRDRQFAAELALGTIRTVIRLDHAVGSVSTRPLVTVDPEIRALLRLGTYQILFTRVPPHAAVSETVDLARGRARGYVNAVLRGILARPPKPSRGNGPEAVSARTGLAAWAVAELARLLPPEDVEPAAAALASPAELTIRTNTCRVGRPELEASLRQDRHRVLPGRFHPDVLRVPGAAPARLPGFGEGWFAVQDEASVLVGAAVEARIGERILDACAAPGGKAAHLACLVGSQGRVVAGDVHPGRARLVRETALRLGVSVLVVAQDARAPALRGGFDAILVDAPCSGLGAARRRPELLWRPSSGDLARLARLQVSILTGAAELLRPGGRLVYSVCTFPRAETDAAVRALLRKRNDLRPAPVPGPRGEAPIHRLWPHRDGTDAMFIAGFRRG